MYKRVCQVRIACCTQPTCKPFVLTMGRTERLDSVLAKWSVNWVQQIEASYLVHKDKQNKQQATNTKGMNNHQVHSRPSNSIETKPLASASRKTTLQRTEGLETDGLDKPLPVIVCPGFNQAELTDGLVRSLPYFTRPYVVRGLPISPFDIYQWLSDTFGNPATQPPLVGIGFSAGVIGLAGALFLWQQAGGKVARLFAVDGWGVPLLGLSVVRISHDRFTHLTTLPLGAGELNFYADPSVEHLSLWGAPDQVMGRSVPWWQTADGVGDLMSAQDFLAQSLRVIFNSRL